MSLYNPPVLIDPRNPSMYNNPSVASTPLDPRNPLPPGQARPDARRGWTGASIAPDPHLHNSAQSSLASRVIGGPSINSLATTGTTSQDWHTSSPGLHDSVLGSRHFMNPGTGFRDTAATGSVYGQADVPAFLQSAVSNLNATQSLQAANHNELINRILTGMEKGGADEYLWTEALRAGAVSPGAHVGFGQAVQNPLIGQGYNTQAQANANLVNNQAQAVNAPNLVNKQLQDIQQQQQSLGPAPFGTYLGSQQQGLDQQMIRLQSQQPATNAIAARAAGVSGWAPQLPTY